MTFLTIEGLVANDMYEVWVMRHGEKDGQGLSPKGAMQVFMATQALKAMGVEFDGFLSSPLERARQGALIAMAALGVFDAGGVGTYNGFSFMPTRVETLGEGEAGKHALMAEGRTIKANGGTVAQALTMSDFARRGRGIMIRTTLQVMWDMYRVNLRRVLALAHSPWLELAAVNTMAMPYGLKECDAVRYVVQNGAIEDSGLIAAPPEVDGKPLF